MSDTPHIHVEAERMGTSDGPIFSSFRTFQEDFKWRPRPGIAPHEKILFGALLILFSFFLLVVGGATMILGVFSAITSLVGRLFKRG